MKIKDSSKYPRKLTETIEEGSSVQFRQSSVKCHVFGEVFPDQRRSTWMFLLFPQNT